jgi:hypothetical protein
MKKHIFTTIILSCLSVGAYCADAPETKTESPAQKEELKSPFNVMTPSEQTETGVKKLSGSEQEALVKWWAKQKNHPQLQISKEVTLTAIQDDGKYIVLSDGTRLSVAKSTRKKIAKWVVGDKIGIGEAGRRGALTLYHMATGHKVKVKRDQAPEKSSEKHK